MEREWRKHTNSASRGFGFFVFLSSFSVVLWKTGYFSLEWERECVIMCVMYASGFNK